MATEGTTRFVVLLYEDEQVWERADEAQRQAVLTQHDDYSARAAEHGVTIVGGEALKSTEVARTVRHTDTATTTVTEGPFAETTEQLGGFYVVDATSIDDVLRHAALLPSSYAVEVREVFLL